jgi:DNA-binding transcriptional MerR regulator
MTVAEVAELLGVTEWAVRSWKRRRKGPPFYQIVGMVRYRRRDVVAWLDSCQGLSRTDTING